MSVLLPRIGATDCHRALVFIENYSENVVGAFFVMCGYGFEKKILPTWWYDLTNAQEILDKMKDNSIGEGHGDPLYLGYCIIVTASPGGNPADISFLIQHIRMCTSEGGAILELLAKFNIPVNTDAHFPSWYLFRRGKGKLEVEDLAKSDDLINEWTVRDWEDYCSYILANDNSRMLKQYFLKYSLSDEIFMI